MMIQLQSQTNGFQINKFREKLLILGKLPHVATSFHMCLGRKIPYITFLTHQNKVFIILNPYQLKTQNLRGPIAKSKDEVLSSSNRESGKFWTSIPLPVSSPSSSLSLSLSLKRVIYIC